MNEIHKIKKALIWNAPESISQKLGQNELGVAQIVRNRVFFRISAIKNMYKACFKES